MKDKKPFVVHRFQLILFLCKLWHLKIKECQLIIEHMLVIYIHQLHFVAKAVLGIFVIGKDKIQYSDCIDSFKFKIPYSFLPLILNRESGIEHTSVLKKLLLSLLHLYDERLALLILAVYIKDGTAVAIAVAKVLTIKIGKISHYFLAFEQRVEKADQQILIERSTKQFLKSEVCIRIDIFGISHFFYVL